MARDLTIERTKYAKPLGELIRAKGIMISDEELLKTMDKTCESASEMFYWFKGAMFTIRLIDDPNHNFFED